HRPPPIPGRPDRADDRRRHRPGETRTIAPAAGPLLLPRRQWLRAGRRVTGLRHSWSPEEYHMGLGRRFAATAFLVLAAIAPAGAAEPEQTPIFVAGRDGYHTYRIPSLLVTRKGTLLAFCEGRKTSRGDTGDIDLLLKRSYDGGKTWAKTQVVW